MGSTSRSERSSSRRHATRTDDLNPGSENNRSRQGFTLFEIAISLAIMGFAVVSVLMVFPLGLKQQQQARARLLSATKTMELIEYFAGKSNIERMAEFETPEPWDTRPYCYTNTRWDLETRLARFDSGIRPLPLDIAKRLDSDGDEIQNLLTEGAHLYYADAAMLPGVDIRIRNPSAPVEANKIIFAVSGYAQNNAVQVLPWKAWPYRAGYPSPPLASTFREHNGDPARPTLLAPQDATNVSFSVKADTKIFPLEGWTQNGATPATPTDRDPLFVEVYKKAQEYTETATPFTVPPRFAISQRPAKRNDLANACLAYAESAFSRAGIALEYQTYVVATGATTATAFDTLAQTWNTAFINRCRAAEVIPSVPATAPPDTTRELARTRLGLEVQAWRFLAMAAATYYDRQESEPEPDWATLTMGTIPLTADRLRYYHDRCTQSAMRYAASFPNDWTAPRPHARAIMMDHPLIEFDLFAPPRKRKIAGAGTIDAAMWRPISSQRITGIGLPGIFPGVLSYNPANPWDSSSSPFAGVDPRTDSTHPLWGNAKHFTLTRPFHPRERCRELVFWTVDWQSYEDAELAPAAPLDASRTICNGVDRDNLASYDGRLGGGVSTEDALHLRNPERMISFTRNVSSLADGSDITNALNTGGSDQGGGARTVLLGIYGADRNRNYLLDRGPVPKSVRMRATQTARFVFYDPRLPITLR